jgi:hypothetical protein
MSRSGLPIRLVRLGCAVLLPSVAACQRATDGAPCELPAATAEYQHIDDTLVFELPDSGGFIANGMVIARDELGTRLRTVFAPRAPNGRAIFVQPVPASRCADLAFLQGRARDAGVAVFDAHKSGWPGPTPPLPDTAR